MRYIVEVSENLCVQKMKTIVTVVFTTLAIYHRVSAQEPILDVKANSYSIEDSVLVDRLLDRAKEYQNSYSDLDSSKYWCQNALRIARIIDYPKGQGTASYLLGVNYSRRNQRDSSLLYFKESIKISRKLKDTVGLAQSLHTAGRQYNLTGRYRKALEHYFESSILKQSIGDSISLSWTLNNIGNVYYRQEKFDRALEYYKKTYDIEKKHSSPAEQASTLGNVGLAYMQLKNYPQALDYLKRSHHMLDSLEEKCRLIYTLTNLATTHMELGNLEEAKKSYQIVFDDGQTCDNPDAVCNGLFGLGIIYFEQGFKELAEQSLLEAYEIAKRYDSKPNQLEISESLHELYKSKADYRSALTFLETYKSLREELFNEDLTEQMTTLELNFEFELERDSLAYQKQTELVTINAQLEQQKVFKYLIIIGLIIAVVFLFIIYRNFRLKKAANDYLEKKNRLQEEKLKIQEESRKQLEDENNKKARSLTANSLQLLNLNEKISQLSEEVEQDKEISSSRKKILAKRLENLRNQESQWESIKIHFENVHPDFFQKLEDSFPELSSNDHKLLAFLKMKLSHKEIALILNVTTRAVEQSKRRLKKKLKMDSEDLDILTYISRHSTSKKEQLEVQ